MGSLTSSGPPRTLVTRTKVACLCVHWTPSSVKTFWMIWKVSSTIQGCWGTARPFVEARETLAPIPTPDELAN
jgi:hypothetical protein